MVNLANVEETMVRVQYSNNASNYLKPSANNLVFEKFIFQQGGEPKHTPKHAKEFFDEENLA